MEANKHTSLWRAWTHLEATLIEVKWAMEISGTVNAAPLSGCAT